MTITGHPHVGDVRLLRVTVTSDGTTVVALTGPVTFRLCRPDGTTMDVSADLSTDGTDGQAQYVTGTGDLNMAGAWRIQVQDAAGPWHADTATFRVLGNLVEPV